MLSVVLLTTIITCLKNIRHNYKSGLSFFAEFVLNCHEKLSLTFWLKFCWVTGNFVPMYFCSQSSIGRNVPWNFSSLDLWLHIVKMTWKFCSLVHIQARIEGSSTGSIEPPSAASSTCIHVIVVVLAINCLTFLLKYNRYLQQNEPFQVKKSQNFLGRSHSPLPRTLHSKRTPPAVYSILGLLDLSAAFVCVDHSMLLDRLRSAVVLSGSVLDWVAGAVIFDWQKAADCLQWSTNCCAAGAVWGSARIRTGPAVVPSLHLVVARHGLNLHQYTDDTQVYVSTSARDTEAAVARLTACLVDIEAWLKASRLRLNPIKTQVMWLGSPQQLAKVNVLEVLVSASQRRRVTSVASSTVSCLCLHR